jgi:hypothetical protein
MLRECLLLRGASAGLGRAIAQRLDYHGSVWCAGCSTQFPNKQNWLNVVNIDSCFEPLLALRRSKRCFDSRYRIRVARAHKASNHAGLT